MSLNILFVGDLSSNNNTLFRYKSLKRLGYNVKPLNIINFTPKIKFLYWINYRYQPSIFNIKLLQILKKEILNDYSLIWIEKGIFIDIRKIKNKKRIPIIHFNPDNPFGKRHDGCWKLFIKNISLYDCHLTPRLSDNKFYKKITTKKKYTFPFCYDEKIHYYENLNKNLDVTFVGSNHDNRYEFVKKVEKILGFKINIYSDNWKGNYNKGVYGDEYRKIINKSKVMINFITNSNVDEYSRRSIEMAACKCFFISQKGKVQEKIFRESRETFYFNNELECAYLIKEYLISDKKRDIISENAYQRVNKLRLNNKYQMKKIIEKVLA